LGEDVRVADVAGVDDLVTALERGEGFGAEEVVGVGDQGGFHVGFPRIFRVEVAAFGQ
jgi:hypothetical protein